MARIRTIKPEFWTDDAVGECSVSARLLFIATWNFADDKGGLDRSAKQLKAQAFPYDVIDCEPLIQELLRHRLLIEYERDGRKYLHINGFLKHQKIDNPAKPRIPPYEEEPEKAEDSPRTPLGLAPEGKGRESNGKEESASAPAGLDLPTWTRWVAYRSQIRKPLKPASIPAAQRKLAAFGRDQAAVIEEAISNGWTGFFALKAAPEKPSGRPSNVPDEREIQDLQERARKIGFRDRNPAESLGGYRTLLEREELALRNRGGAPVRAVPTLVRQ